MKDSGMHGVNANSRMLTISSAELHDLKNRLTVIKGMTQLLARQTRRDDWQRQRVVDRLQALEAEVVRLESMINDLARGGSSRRHQTCADDVSHRQAAKPQTR
jgi:signal transduction histidine kinase